jgi:hypothetical protein
MSAAVWVLLVLGGTVVIVAASIALFLVPYMVTRKLCGMSWLPGGKS